MLDAIPGKEELTVLVGKPLYEVWTALCALIEERYDWIVPGIGAEKRGHTITNTAGAAKRCAHYMPGKTAWVC